MAYKIIIDEIEKEQWEKNAGNFMDYNLYQTWPYQQVRAETDRQGLSRIMISDEADQVSAMCQMRIKQIKLLGLKIGYIQWGPLFRKNEMSINCLKDVLELIKKTYLGTRVNVLRIIPNIFTDQMRDPVADIFQASGFEPVNGVAPYHTMIYPLDANDEEMRKRLHRSWRRYLNKAEKNDIEIRHGTNMEYFDILEQLYDLALDRKGFKGLDPQVFIRTQRCLSVNEKMNTVVAYYNNQPVAAHITSHLGDTALGILAAANEDGLRCNATYLVWWKTLLAARQARMKKYDLGGIDPVNNPDVYQFKLRMGTQEAHHVGVFEASSSLRAKITWHQVEKIYKLVKKK